MTEISPLSSAPLLLKNVTVNPNVFELKKCYRFCGSPSDCSNSHHDIIFGDLAYVKCVSGTIFDRRYGFDRPYRDFSRGNYSISVVNFNQAEANPMIILHLENFDPSLLATALLDGKDENEGNKNEVSAVERCGYVLGAMDCTCTLSIDSRSYKKSINKHQSAIDDNCAQPTSELASGLKLIWKSDPTDVENTAGFRAPHLDGLFYFVNAATWFEYCNFPDPYRSYSSYADAVEISALTAGIYQLRSNNETIGLAINTGDVFGDAEVSSVVVKDRSASCLALVLHGSVEHGIHEVAEVALPQVGLFLYERVSVYRSFYEFGKEMENPYYGYDEDNEFARLPEIVFAKILSYLPWRQRIQCRRVNKRWRAMSNEATAIDTKVIDLSIARYKGMRLEHLDFVLPMVSKHLEEFIWRNIFNFEGIGNVKLFPKLRKIHIEELLTPDFDSFFSLLNKCPNLNEIIAPIPRRPSASSCTPGPYNEVEKLCLINKSMLTDPWLIELTNYFPKLTSLRIEGYGFLSSSCISAVAEKYGETLTRLEIERLSWTGIASMIGAIIGFRSCPYLEYLSLIGTEFISDPCMAAIAAGCAKLTTLDIMSSGTVTNKGLATLASLPNLKRLDLSHVGSGEDLSFGIAQVAEAGHLEQLLVKNAPFPSPACLKSCVRYCRQLKVVDISSSTADISIDDAKEIIQLYGTCGLQSRLIIRSGNITWRNQAVRIVQDEVTETFNRRFLVGRPHWACSKWAPEDDSDPVDYQGLFDCESDHDDEDDGDHDDEDDGDHDDEDDGDADNDIEDDYDYDLNDSYGEVYDSDFSG